jgi:LacI family transcriptional regulator
VTTFSRPAAPANRPLGTFSCRRYDPPVPSRGHRGSARPTLADVAAAAGVSRTTASRALSDEPNVSAAARARVWSAAQRLQFEPNHLARSLRRGRTMGVGVVVPHFVNLFYAAAVHGAQEVLEAAGYHVLILNSQRSASRERAALRSLRAHQVDGLIVATCGGYEDIGVPTAFFDDVPADVGVGGIALDNERGIALLVEHLVQEHGHRRIAYIGHPAASTDGPTPQVFVGRERLEAFRAAAGGAGLALPPELIRLAEPSAPADVLRATASQLLALDEPPSAVVAGTDTLALGVMDAMRAAALRAPEDVAVVSFDEPVHPDLLDPPMTSLGRHDRELGARAAEMLLRALTAPDDTAAPTLVRVPLELRVRRSCGCGGPEDASATRQALRGRRQPAS